MHPIKENTPIPNPKFLQMRLKSLLYIIPVVLLFSCAKNKLHDHPEWGKYYDAYGIKNAAFIMRDHTHDDTHYYNKAACLRRLLPASTFKIFNSLVALETAVAPDENLVIKWDGIVRRPEWDKDMDMKEAFKVSNLAYYQEIARRVGPAKMQHYLDTAHYGSMAVTSKIDEFWLDNSLKISADEQVGLLKRMYFFELPFSERSQRIVKSLMLREDTLGYKLYYKTGTGIVGDSVIYWVVGFTESRMAIKEPNGSMNKADYRDYPYFFAQNFVIARKDTSQNWFKVRFEIMHQVLKDYGAIPPTK